METYFTFDGIRSIDKGLRIQTIPQMTGADRDVTFQSVPGRKNGDLILDNDRFTNYNQEYDCWADPVDGQSLFDLARDVQSWLQIPVTYKKLIDSRDPNYYREAVCVTNMALAPTLINFGQAKVIFNCKPFRRRIDGDTVRPFTASGILTNPEQWESEPYIKITGSGDIKLRINDQEIVLTGVSDYIEIDSEMQSCFKGIVLQNSHYRSDFWPFLNVGDNQISWTGNVSKVEIKPRWRTL
jgi:phage-related protein